MFNFIALVYLFIKQSSISFFVIEFELIRINTIYRSNFSAFGSANAMYSALDKFDEKEREDSGDTVQPSASKPGSVGLIND